MNFGRFLLLNYIENKLLQDNAISKNGLYSIMTFKADELFQSKYNLELEELSSMKKEKELRERDSLMNQLSVKKADEQNEINR